MIVRDIKTKTVVVLDDNQKPVLKDGRTVTQIVPELDANGKEIELWSFELPEEIVDQGPEAVDAYVATKRAEFTAPAPAPATKAQPKGDQS